MAAALILAGLSTEQTLAATSSSGVTQADGRVLSQASAKTSTAKPSPPSDPLVRVRAEDRKDHMRLVFEWPQPVDYELRASGNSALVRFGRTARMDLAGLRKLAHPLILGSQVTPGRDELNLQLMLAAGTTAQSQQQGRRVIIDLYPSAVTEPASGTPASEAKPVDRSGSPASEADAPPSPAPSPPPRSPSPPVSGVRFDWQRPVGAALFRRGDAVWLVFAATSRQDLKALKTAGQGRIVTVAQPPHDEATILRMHVSADARPRLYRDGTAWVLGLSEQRETAVKTLTVELSASPAITRLSISHPGSPLIVNDAEVGDNMVVIPLLEAGTGLAQGGAFPTFRLLPTVQGIVVIPHTDALAIEAHPDALAIIPQIGGLVAPSDETIASEPVQTIPQRLSTLFDLPAPVASLSFVQRRQQLESEVAMSSGIARESHRMRLCGFLLSHGYAAECLGTLKLIGEDRPAIETERHFRFLRGVAQVLMGRFDQARRDLASDGLADDDDGRLWRAALSARSGSPKQRWQLEPAERWQQTLDPYPPILQFALARSMAEAAIETGRQDQAEKLIKVAEKVATDTSERAWVLLLKGRQLAGRRNGEPALAFLTEAANSSSHQVRTYATYALTDLALRLNRLTPAEALTRLEELRYAWRGDRFELQLLRRMGQLQMEADRPADGLRDLMTAARRFADYVESVEIRNEAMAAFENLFLGDAANRLRPLTAVALYDEFHELATNSRKSRELALTLSDRLIEADLLSRADKVLSDLLASSTEGTERARIGLKLAEIRCLDRRPQEALDALIRSASKSIPEDLASSRRKQEAMALAQLRRSREALAAVANDRGADAERLRANIHGSDANWKQAGASLSRLLEPSADGGAQDVSSQRSHTLLDAAAALALAGDSKGLADLAENHKAVANTHPMAPAIRLLTGQSDPPAPTVGAVRAYVEEALAVRPLLAPTQAPTQAATQPPTASAAPATPGR